MAARADRAGRVRWRQAAAAAAAEARAAAAARREARADRGQRARRRRHGRQRARPHGARRRSRPGSRRTTHELSDCYTKKRRSAGAGSAVTSLIHWDIKKDGTVTAVKLAESDLGAWPIEKCLLDVARAATFDKPIGGDADFTLPLDFTATGATLPWRRGPGAAGGRRSARQARRVRQEARACRDDVTITLYVGPHGKAQSVGFSSARPRSTTSGPSAPRRPRMAWRLPDPQGHGREARASGTEPR